MRPEILHFWQVPENAIVAGLQAIADSKDLYVHFNTIKKKGKQIYYILCLHFNK